MQSHRELIHFVPFVARVSQPGSSALGRGTRGPCGSRLCDGGYCAKPSFLVVVRFLGGASFFCPYQPGSNDVAGTPSFSRMATILEFLHPPILSDLSFEPGHRSSGFAVAYSSSKLGQRISPAERSDSRFKSPPVSELDRDALGNQPDVEFALRNPNVLVIAGTFYSSALEQVGETADQHLGCFNCDRVLAAVAGRHGCGSALTP